MSVIAIFAGGLQQDAGNGCRSVIFYSTLSSFVDDTDQAPYPGMRALAAVTGSTGYESWLPMSDDVADSKLTWFPARASTTYLAAYLELTADDLIAAIDNDPMQLFEFHADDGIGGSKRRQLAIVSVFSTDESESATANVTTTAATLTDTGKAWTVNDPNKIGRYVCCNGKKLFITSNDATTLYGAGWERAGVPGNNQSYQIQALNYPKFKFRLTDGVASSADSTTLHLGDGPFILELKTNFQNAAGNTRLQVGLAQGDSIPEIVLNAGQAITVGFTSCKFAVKLLSTDGGSGKTSGGWDQSLVRVWTGVIYDDEAQIGSDGIHAWDSWPLYDTTVAPPRPVPAPVNRFLITRRKIPTNASAYYDQATKNGAATVGQCLGDSATLPNSDTSTYISDTTTGHKQSWAADSLGRCDIPITSGDVIYAVASTGYLQSDRGAAGGTPHKAFHTDGSGTDDAGRGVVSGNGFGDPGGYYYCANKAPDGSAWTFAKAGTCQSAIQTGTVTTLGIRLNSAIQLILFKKGNAPPAETPDEPVQVAGVKGLLRRPQHDPMILARPDAAIMRALEDVRGSFEETARR